MKPFNPKENGLCEFIKDCEHTSLAVKILHLLGQEGPRTSRSALLGFAEKGKNYFIFLFQLEHHLKDGGFHSKMEGGLEKDGKIPVQRKEGIFKNVFSVFKDLFVLHEELTIVNARAEEPEPVFFGCQEPEPEAPYG